MTELFEQTLEKHRRADAETELKLSSARNETTAAQRALEEAKREITVLKIAFDHAKAETGLLQQRCSEQKKMHLELASLRLEQQHSLQELESAARKARTQQEAVVELQARLATSVPREEHERYIHTHTYIYLYVCIYICI